MHLKYKKLRNKAVKLIRMDVRHRLVTRLANGDVWKAVNAVRGTKVEQDNGIKEIVDKHGQGLRHDRKKAEVFNSLFKSKIEKIRDSLNHFQTEDPFIRLQGHLRIQNTFQLTPVRESEVLEEIKNLKNKSSS